MPFIDRYIYRLTVNGCGIMDISRVLGISKNTVIKRIVGLSGKTVKHENPKPNGEYEIDEVYTRVSGRPCWIIYAIEKSTKQPIAFSVGGRSNETIGKVTGQIMSIKPLRIHTDQLINYKGLIPKGIHSTKKAGTNGIERYNLNLRTHLKRLARRTICGSRSMGMLTAVLRLYFWGGQLNLGST